MVILFKSLEDLPKKRSIFYYLNIFRIYYGIYYFNRGKQVVENPQLIKPSLSARNCIVEIDPDKRGEHNFIYVSQKISKIFFWHYNFAFRYVGEESWFSLPKLFPWEYKNGQSKIGLDKRFVRKLSPRAKIEIVMW